MTGDEDPDPIQQYTRNVGIVDLDHSETEAGLAHSTNYQYPTEQHESTAT